MATRLKLALLLVPTIVGCMDFGGFDEPVELDTHVDDWRDEVIYQVLVDRFANGDYANDDNVRFDDLARYQGGDWRGLEDRLDYLEELGVTALWISPVVKNVDTDANVDGYHGYWAQDMSATNPHMGDIAALRSLVAAAHGRDMKVVVDIVTNHVGQAFFYDMNLNGVADINLQNDGGAMPVRHYTEYDPDFDPRGVYAFTSLGEAGPAPIVFQWDPATNHVPPEPALFQDPAAYNRKGRTFDFDDPDQLLHGDFPGGLKDIATDRCDVRQEMVDVYARWVERTDIDGFRIDTIKHVDYGFWRYFTQRLRQRLAPQGKTRFLMFGEVFDGRDALLGSYTRKEIRSDADVAALLGRPSPWPDVPDADLLAAEQACVGDGEPLTGDQLDSVFYFSQHFQAVRDVFQAAQATTPIRTLWEQRPTTWGTEPNALGIGVAPAQMPINFLDNHDVARFLYGVRDRPEDVRRGLLHNALLFQFTAQGVPCVYYGTEQEFSGGNDPANRERLWDSGFDTGNPTFALIRRLADFRHAYASLRKGDVAVLWATDRVGDESDAGIFAFERLGGDGGGSYAVVVLNTNQVHASSPRFEDEVMFVTAPPGTVLVDVLVDGANSYVVADDGSLDVLVPPMSGVLLVPEAELVAGQ